MMGNMAVLTESLAVSGVKDEQKQFLDFPLVVSVFGRTAATLAKTSGIRQYLSGPRSATSVVSDDRGQVAKVVALPVGRSRSHEIHAHPLALASRRAEVILGGARDTAWRTTHNLSALLTGDNDRLVAGSPPSHSARGSTESCRFAGGGGMEGSSTSFTGLLDFLHRFTSGPIV